MWTNHWWYNQPALCRSSTGGIISQVCTSGLLVIQSGLVPQLHWWYNQPGLCHISNGDTIRSRATASLVVQPTGSVPLLHWWYNQVMPQFHWWYNQVLCHSFIGGTTSQVCATGLPVIQSGLYHSHTDDTVSQVCATLLLLSHWFFILEVWICF
jgi:hypothetical protein